MKKSTFIYNQGIDKSVEQIIIEGHVTEEMITKESLVSIQISPKEVNSKDFTRMDNLISVLEKLGKQAYGKILLAFMYDHDPREIYEIAEICDFMKTLLAKCPHIFYFLVPNYEINAAHLYSLAGVRVERVQGGRNITPADVHIFSKFYVDMAIDTLLYGKHVNDKDRAYATLKTLKVDNYVNLEKLITKI